MKESTKYSSYRFVGTMNVDEIMPWFDFDKGKPWDESEVPWVLENKVRREILIKLANLGPKTLEEIHGVINFSPKPLLIESSEYSPEVQYQWHRGVIQNHLWNLEWYGLIELVGKKYQVTFPVLSMDDLAHLDKYIVKFANHWVSIIKEIKEDITQENLNLEILIERSVEKLYEILKNEGFLPKTPNIKALWAEQLRKIKFEEWVSKNF